MRPERVRAEVQKRSPLLVVPRAGRRGVEASGAASVAVPGTPFAHPQGAEFGTGPRTALTAAARAFRRRARQWGALAVLIVLGTGCTAEDTLRPVQSIDIDGRLLVDSVTTTESVVWLSDEQRLVVLYPDRETAAHLELSGNAATRILGAAEGNLLFLANRTVMALNADSAAPFRVTERVGAAILDDVGGILFESIEEGEIVAVRVDSLRPVWGWGGTGANSSALALSPERDRLYQALVPDDPDVAATLRVRDLLSGRTLRTVDIEEPLRTLRVTSGGDLIGAGWADDGSDAFLTRLSWVDGELRTVWNRRVESSGDAGVPGRPKLAVTGDGRRAALVGTNTEAGLALFDGETGSSIAVYSGGARDAAFDGRDRLYLLTDSTILRVE